MRSKTPELAVAHLVHQLANAREARLIVGLAIIDGAADLRVHLRAAQLFGGILRADRRLHQRRSGKKEAAAFGHQDVIAHQRQIRAAGHAHAHDGGDLRNAHRRHHRVVAEDAAEIVGVGEDIFLQRQKDAGRIDQVDRGDVVVDGDVLRADDLLRRHREERAGLHRRIVDDEHDQAALHARQSGHHAGRRRAAPLFIHAPRYVRAKLEELRARIDEQRNAFARGQAALLVLRLDGLFAAALLDDFFFVADTGDQFGHGILIALEARGVGLDLGVETADSAWWRWSVILGQAANYPR